MVEALRAEGEQAARLVAVLIAICRESMQQTWKLWRVCVEGDHLLNLFGVTSMMLLGIALMKIPRDCS